MARSVNEWSQRKRKKRNRASVGEKNRETTYKGRLKTWGKGAENKEKR